MANWFSDKSPTKFRVTISRFVQSKHYTEYEVIVQFPSAIHWRIMKRYSDFAKLYNDLSEMNNDFKVYFPPKKLFKATSDHFLNQRKRSLEIYMNEIISVIKNYLPRPLAKFLEMEKYEIHGITTKLAKMLFKHGEVLINNKRTFEISILSVYAINQRMLSPAPTNIYNLHGEDFGHVLDVLESTKKVKIIPYALIQGAESLCGTSNIKSELLLFDISIFSGAQMLELNSVEINNLRGLYKMNSQVEVLEAHHCLKSLEDILFGDIAYMSSTIEDLVTFCGPWSCTKTIDFSNNSITCIDKSIVTLKQVSNLNLSHNQISEIDNLQYLTFLTELDLSYNNLVMCENVSFSHRLGSVKKLTLKGNKLSKLTLIDRMFSLEYLDISENNINEFKAFLPFCRLSCLEKLILKNNPICNRENYLSIIFDIFLDQINSVKINETSFSESSVIQNEVYVRRQLKESILLDSFNLPFQNGSIGGFRTIKNNNQNLLMSIDVDIKNLSKKNSIINNPDIYNIMIYWFFPAVKRSVLPSKILWCTQIFSPKEHIKPAPILLISCNALNACILQCSVKISVQNSNTILTLKPLHFLDLNKSLRNLVIGADKLFIRFDMNNDTRALYLINNSHYIDSFMGHLYHIDDEIVKFGDSRLVYLNEEDRLESLRRFIDIWRHDMVTSLLRSGENKTINTDTESEILFSSRALLQNPNGFQLLLTIVVTRQMLCLVDERIYDWPDLIKRPSVNDFTYMANSSPQTSSSSQFQFLRVNAYFFYQVKSCIKQPASPDNILSTWAPTFTHSLQILFNSNPKEPMYLHFENSQKTENACNLINQLCENEECCLLPVNPYSEPVNIRHVVSEIPTNLKYLNSSFHEIRLSLSLFCPKLSSIAQSTLNEIVSFCHSKMQLPETSKINGIIWTKFIYFNYESNDACQIKRENPCLICLSSNNIDIVYEIEESSHSDNECWSDPESDQPDSNSLPTKLYTISLDLDNIFKIYIGLYNQWITLCFRTNEQSSENRRLILIIRNNDLVKQFINWLKLSFKDRSIERKLSDILEYSHDTSNIDELLFQIRKTSKCEDIDLIHYTSIEDVRIDSPSIIDISADADSNDSFTYAVVITNSNISIIRHNVAEYPVRHFGQGAIRQSPRHLQYQIVIVIPLYECTQLQLPGHDKNLLIIMIQSNQWDVINSLFKIQLSVNCQKEQKNLIDKLREQFKKCLQVETPLRVIVS